MKFIRKHAGSVPVLKNGSVPLLTYPSLDRTGLVVHGFTTRSGGVSTGIYSSLNLSFSRGDREEDVRGNFRRLARAFGIRPDQFVFSDQTHTVNVREVTEADRGKGLARPLDYHDVDGLVTDTPGLMLSTFYADCVPLFFVDPVRHAIGLSHSGWRGTVKRMGAVTLEKMHALYGTDPSDVVAAIGPSICRDCYEVGPEVAGEFRAEFGSAAEAFLEPGAPGHFQLDLWAANRQILLDAGVRPEHLSITDICTCCNPDLLFSHRASKGKRGNLGAFLMLR